MSRGSRTKPLICLVSSPGGHLAQLEALLEAFDTCDVYLVTVRSPQAESTFANVRRHFICRIARDPATLFMNALQSLRLLLRERPDAVVSAGAGTAVPTMLIAACIGIPVVFVESMARVDRPSLTGRVVRRWADLVLVQWSSLGAIYPRAICVSPIYQPSGEPSPIPEKPRILVLTGTGTRGFDRLLRALDAMVERGEVRGSVYAQIGESTYVPKSYEYTRFLPHQALLEAIRASDIVVTHDGAAAIGESLELDKRTIVVPRKAQHGELTYRGGAELARRLDQMNWITLVENPADIAIALGRRPHVSQTPESADRPTAVTVLRKFATGLAEKLQVREVRA